MARRAAPEIAVDRPSVEPGWKRSLARRLLAWYGAGHRDLPWRRDADAYRVWVSEIMLQQTQVATVVPYFQRFLAAFPNVAALAAADETLVLRHWEGLGYYRRARQMHRAARTVVERHGGVFPSDLHQVRELPGIGRYTAGAILSIAFDQRQPILEANTQRLLSRLVAYDTDATSSRGREFLWQLSEQLLPARDCGSFNQALMELGSQVCTPREPRCAQCPLNTLCQARQLGSQQQLGRLPGPAITAVREAAIVVCRGRKVLLRQRTTGERWAGLWDFLRFEISQQQGDALLGELRRKVLELSGLTIETPRPIATLKHGVTRFRITLECFSTGCQGRVKLPDTHAWRWVATDALDDYPLSTTGRKLAKKLLARA